MNLGLSLGGMTTRLGLGHKTHIASSLSLGLVFKYWSRQSVPVTFAKCY